MTDFIFRLSNVSMFFKIVCHWGFAQNLKHGFVDCFYLQYNVFDRKLSQVLKYNFLVRKFN